VMVTIELSQGDNDSTVAAHVGDEIVVVLPERSTAGFRWQLETADDVLKPVSEGYRQTTEADEAEPVFGRPSLREFRVQVTAPGKSRLALKHLQEFEKNSVDARFAVVIDASPAGPADVGA
jgi:predicted secreted protein